MAVNRPPGEKLAHLLQNLQNSTTTCSSAASGAGRIRSACAIGALLRSSLMAQGLIDSSFQSHPDDREEKRHQSRIAEILTHAAAFMPGWPKFGAAFNMAKEVWAEDETLT